MTYQALKAWFELKYSPPSFTCCICRADSPVWRPADWDVCWDWFFSQAFWLLRWAEKHICWNQIVHNASQIRSRTRRPNCLSCNLGTSGTGLPFLCNFREKLIRQKANRSFSFSFSLLFCQKLYKARKSSNYLNSHGERGSPREVTRLIRNGFPQLNNKNKILS